MTTRSVEWRLSAHCTPSARAAHSPVGRWVLGLSKVGVRPLIRELVEAPDPILGVVEDRMIEAAKRSGEVLLNARPGGGRPGWSYWTGKKRDPESVAKSAAKLRGRKNGPPSEATRQKLSLAQKGKRRGPHGRRPCQDIIDRWQVAGSSARRRIDLDIAEIVRRREAGESFRAIGRALGADHHLIGRRYKEAIS